MEDIRIKRYQLLIALTTLVGALIVSGVSVYQQMANAKQLGTLSATIKDSEDLRHALLKPLEGVWDLQIDYKKFHGKNGYQAEGKAIFIWKPDRNKYLIYVGLGASKKAETFDNSVTWFLESHINANQYGYPAETFKQEFKYIYRTGIEEFKHPTARRVVTTMNYVRPESITNSHIITGTLLIKDESSITKSIITFTKE